MPQCYCLTTHCKRKMCDRLQINMSNEDIEYIYEAIRNDKYELLQKQINYTTNEMSKLVLYIQIPNKMKFKYGISNLVVVYAIRNKLIITIMNKTTAEIDTYRNKK